MPRVSWSASWARPYQLLFLALVQPFPGVAPVGWCISTGHVSTKNMKGEKHNDHGGPSIYDIHGSQAWHNYASFTWRHNAIFRIHRLWMGCLLVESEGFECKTCGSKLLQSRVSQIHLQLLGGDSTATTKLFSASTPAKNCKQLIACSYNVFHIIQTTSAKDYTSECT